jgi:hypothetical protein
MEYQAKSRLRWSNGEHTDHKIDLDLDLLVSDILKSSTNIEARLQANEQGIREEIFQLVLAKILPRIIADTGVDSRQPEGNMSTKGHSSTESQAEVGKPTKKETSLYIRDRIHMVLDLTTDRPVNAIQALYANRGGVASEISNEVMKMLKRSVLKTHDEETETSWSISDNQLKSLDHRAKKSSSERN